jgi:hypothetical protein
MGVVVNDSTLGGVFGSMRGSLVVDASILDRCMLFCCYCELGCP